MKRCAEQFPSCGRCCALSLIMSQPPELVGRAYRFSLAALRFYRKLPKSPEAQVPGVQFYKAATSTWSNYRASQRGRSRAEFIAKLGTAVEESDEAVGWLEFLRDGEIGSDGALLAEGEGNLRDADRAADERAQPGVRLALLLFTFHFLLSIFIFLPRLNAGSEPVLLVGSGHVV